MFTAVQDEYGQTSDERCCGWAAVAGLGALLTAVKGLLASSLAM
jgi:hypothetical protein